MWNVPVRVVYPVSLLIILGQHFNFLELFGFHLSEVLMQVNVPLIQHWRLPHFTDNFSNFFVSFFWITDLVLGQFPHQILVFCEVLG